MELLNAYLEEIRHRLPPKNRADIIAEIRSALMDMIEERNPSPGSDPDEATIKTVLQAYGSPQKVARQYSTHQYLIGPEIFPNYLQVLKIVLLVVTVVNLVLLVIGAISGTLIESGTGMAILETLSGLINTLFIAFGFVTLSFTLIERFASEPLEFETEEEWSPDNLEIVAQKERIKISELAFEITLGIIFIVFINVYLDKFGIYYVSDGSWVSAPILNDNILRYIPWVTVVTALDIALNLYLIRKRSWDMPASIGKVLINIFKIGIIVAIIVGPAIITIDPVAWEALNLDLGISAAQLNQQLNTVLNVLLGLANLGLVVEIIKRLYQTFFKKEQTGFTI